MKIHKYHLIRALYDNLRQLSSRIDYILFELFILLLAY